MANAANISVARQLGSLFESGSAAGLSDRQLIERFVAGRDSLAAEAAFAAIVARHGPMVLGVCHQLLGDAQHAEDAFQATFLVLARRARSIRDPDRLGPWLYGVALRTARDARARLARIRRIEEAHAMRHPDMGTGAGAPAERAAIDREQAEALHGEVERLPTAYRVPLVLCYFEGLSLAEAARRLRCPPGTVHSRLDRAKEKLRRGLLRRGFALSTAALAAGLAPRSASACIPPLLCDLTTRAAVAFAAHRAATGALSAPAAALAQEVLRSMLVHMLRLGFTTVLALAVLAAGTSRLTRALAMKQGPMRDLAAPVAQAAPRLAEQPRTQAKPDPATAARMTMTGRVLGPDGRPAASVPVAVIGTSRRVPQADTDVDRAPYVVLGQGKADADGRFGIEAARGSSARFFAVYALAGAAGPGSAFGCAKLHPDDERPTVEIHLPPEQVIRGRLVDIHGQPAAGVEVRLAWVSGPSSLPLPDGGHFDRPLIPRGGSVRPPTSDELTPWPKPVATDERGRFALAGICRGLHVALAVRDPRFAPQEIDLRAADRDAGKEVAQAIYPATTIEGRVMDADNGRPIPGAAVAVTADSPPGSGIRMTTSRSRADDLGWFRLYPFAGDSFRMRAVPPEGQPYLPGEIGFTWTKGAIKKDVALALARGVPVRGTVTERGTGRPVPGAALHFIARRRPGQGIGVAAMTGEDGTYRVAVPPGPGHLMVLGPTPDYVPEEIADGRLYEGGKPGGQRLYAHAILPYDLGGGVAPRDLNPTLKPARPLRGCALDPEGRPVADALILVRQQFDPDRFTWPGPDFLRAHDGRFELRGFDPDKSAPAYFLDAEHEWGAAVGLSGRPAGEDLVIRLEPCGRARARFVGPDGKPVAGLNVFPYIQLLMTSGAPRIMGVGRAEEPAADAISLPRVDFRHYPNGPSTDDEGRVILPDLIPGATYRLLDYSARSIERGEAIRKDFAVKAGETLDLGEILVEKPEAGRLTPVRPPTMKSAGAPKT